MSAFINYQLNSTGFSRAKALKISVSIMLSNNLPYNSIHILDIVSHFHLYFYYQVFFISTAVFTMLAVCSLFLDHDKFFYVVQLSNFDICGFCALPRQRENYSELETTVVYGIFIQIIYVHFQFSNESHFFRKNF